MNKRKKLDGFWNGILHMGLGTVAAQMINILVQPLLTRILPAETLGIYTYVVSLASIVIPIANLKLDMLIVTEEDEERAQYITDTCVVLNILVAAVYGLVLVVGYFLPVDNIFQKYGPIVFWVPLLVMTNGLRFLFIGYSNRYKQYGLISRMGIYREGSRALIQVLSGVCHLGVTGLNLGYGLAPLFGLWGQTKEYRERRRTRAGLSREKFREILCLTGRRQILYMVPAQFINSFSSSLVTMSVTALYTARELGFYSMGVRILEIPIIFITANVSRVFFQKVSESVRDGERVLGLFGKVLALLFGVTVFGFGLLYLIAPGLCGFVFGEGYDVAGIYIRALCVMYGGRLVASSFAGVYTVFGRQNLELLFNGMLVVVGIGAAVAAEYLHLPVEGYLQLVGMGYGLIYLGMVAGYIILFMRHDKYGTKRLKDV